MNLRKYVSLPALVLLMSVTVSRPAFPQVPSAQWPKAIALTTAGVGSGMHIYGAAASALIEKYTKVVGAVQPCASSSEAIQLLAKGEAQMATGNAVDSLYVYTGVAPFIKAPETVRGFTGAYRANAHFIVRADSRIKTFADLKGKKAMFQRPGQPTFEQAYPAILKAYGLTVKDLTIMPALGYNEAAQGLKEKTADVFFHWAAPPGPAFLDLARAIPIRILTVDKEKMPGILKEVPFLTDGWIKGGTYSGEPNDVYTLVNISWLIIAKKMPDDFAYAALKAMAEHIPDLEATHAMFKGWTPKDLAADPVIPYHAGVFKYYKDTGVMTPAWEQKHFDMLKKMGQQN